jgi:hypothetical protein
LDFFDDTGLLDDPGGRIGVLLLNQDEADATSAMGLVVERLLGERGRRDWKPLADASRTLLAVLQTDDASRGTLRTDS